MVSLVVRDCGAKKRPRKLTCDKPWLLSACREQRLMEGEHTSILQVVRNPSWVLPYVSCILMAIGLLTQFGIHLIGFIRKRAPKEVVSSE